MVLGSGQKNGWQSHTPGSRLLFMKQLAIGMLGIALSVGGLRAADSAATPAGQGGTAVDSSRRLLPNDADKAWAIVEAEGKPPAPPAEWKGRQPTSDEVKVFRQKKASGSGIAADMAREFQERFKDHPKASEARRLYRELLEAAVSLGNENKVAELQALGPDPAKVQEEAAAAAVSTKLQEAVAEARKLQTQGMEAVLGDFEKRLLVLEKEFPGRGEIYAAYLEIAQLRGGEKSKELLAKILKADKVPAQVRAMAEGMQKTQERIGKPLNIAFTATDGRKVDLAQMKGKVVLIDFWATWCGPCVAEVPNVVAAYERLHPKGFEIVGISFDEEAEALKAFTAKHKMSWAQYFDGEGWKNKFGAEFGIRGIPAMWLVDKKGNLRDLEARNDLAAKVEKLLSEP
jgi:thiol-disulfide isomerase/thioredoxin